MNEREMKVYERKRGLGHGEHWWDDIREREEFRKKMTNLNEHNSVSTRFEVSTTVVESYWYSEVSWARRKSVVNLLRLTCYRRVLTYIYKHESDNRQYLGVVSK